MGCGGSKTQSGSAQLGPISSNKFVIQNAAKILSVYDMSKVLGTGAYGKVVLCTHKITKQPRACKVIDKKLLPKGGKDSQAALMNEIDTVRLLDHPNILRMYEFFQDKTFFYIVTEICEGGELFEEIVELSETAAEGRGPFGEGNAALLVRQVLSCISYCHNKGVVHRDLKPENILLEAGKSAKLDKIKIIDFGCAAQWKKGDAKLTKMEGTPYYIAPEVIDQSYTNKCDMWSIGIITYITLSGVPPFGGDDGDEPPTDDQIYAQIKTGKYQFGEQFDYVSEDAKDFIKKLLVLNPDERPSAHEALQHPWIARANEQIMKKMDKEVAKQSLVNLTQFSANSALQTATYAFMASQVLTKDERDEIDKVFRALDVHGDGMLSKELIRTGYKEQFDKAITDKELDEMFEKVDTDKSGEIDYSEFVVAAMSRSKLNKESKLRSAFNRFDADGGGTIDKKELRKMLSFGGELIAQDVIDGIMAKVDANGDGDISFDEFVGLMTSTT